MIPILSLFARFRYVPGFEANSFEACEDFGSAAGDVLASCGCKAAESGELLWCVAGKEDCDT